MRQRDLIVITVRADSSRVPGKWRENLSGLPALDILIRRVSSPHVQVVVATSTRPVDTEIFDWCIANSHQAIRGDYADIRKRLLTAAKAFDAQNIIEILGDNLYVNSEIIDRVRGAFYESVSSKKVASTKCLDYSWVSPSANIFPIGMRPIMYSTDLLEESLAKPLSGHPTSVIYNDPEVEKILVEPTTPFSNAFKSLNLSLNYPRNISHFKEIFQVNGVMVGIREIAEAFDNSPELRITAAQLP